MSKKAATAARPYAGVAWDSARKYRKFFFLGPFFKMFEAVFDLITPILMQTIITKGVIYDSATGYPSGADWNVIALYGCLILAMTIFGFSSTIVCQYMASVASQGTGTDLRNRLYGQIQNLSAADLDDIGIGNAINVVTNDTNQAQQGVAMLIRLAVRAPFLVIGALVASLIIDWEIGLIFLALAVFLSIFLALLMPETSRGYLRVQRKLDKLSQKTDDSLAGARVVRAFDKEEHEVKGFKEYSKGYSDESMRIANITSLLSPVTTFAINAVTILVVLFAGWRGFVTEGSELTSEVIAQQNGKIVVLVNYLNQILQAILVLTNLVVIFTKSYSSMTRIDKVLAVKPSLANTAKVRALAIAEGETLYSLRAVSFCYPGSDVPSLADINISIRKGQKIGVIGGTGAGKTTLLNLLLRFYDRSKGEILYKGHDIEDYDLDSLYGEIGYVPQRPVVFKGSVRENLLASNPHASESDMHKALDLALCDFIEKDPKGLDRMIDEGAKDVSGGQRQRLAIAMALVKKPETLILDNSFSALDYLSEQKLRANLMSLGNGLTQIVVSERVSSLMGADQIIVLDNCRIESIGRMDQLIGKSKVFTDIWNLQKGVTQ